MERQRQTKLVIDSGATSHFIPENMNLLKKGKSNKEVYLPDDTNSRQHIGQNSHSSN